MGEWLAIIMFVLLMGLIVIGYPVAFSFALTAVVFTFIGLGIAASVYIGTLALGTYLMLLTILGLVDRFR